MFKTVHTSDLYNKLVNLSRDKYFYTKLKFEDTFETRIYLIYFFLSIILIINKKKKYKSFSQNSFDGIFKNTEYHLRELGYGDVAVNKKMKLLTKIFYDILLKINTSKNDNFNINKDILVKYFPTINDKNIDLFKIYLIKFHNYCYELNEKSIIEGKIKFDL